MEAAQIIIQMTIRFMISLSLITSDYEAHGIDTEGNQVTFVVDTCSTYVVLAYLC